MTARPPHFHDCVHNMIGTHVCILVSLNLLYSKVSPYILQYSSTVYRDHEGLGFLAPKYLPKHMQLNIYFLTQDVSSADFLTNWLFWSFYSNDIINVK